MADEADSKIPENQQPEPEAATDAVEEKPVAAPESEAPVNTEAEAAGSSETPQAEEAPVAEEEPKAEAAPVAEEEPKAEAAPVTEEEPEAEAAPVTEEEPEAEAAPVTEAEPEAEAAPVTEEEPEAEAAPVAEEEPKAEAAPVTEAEPKPEAAPVAEKEPKPEAAPVAEKEPKSEGAPAAKEEPKAEEAPVAKAEGGTKTPVAGAAATEPVDDSRKARRGRPGAVSVGIAHVKATFNNTVVSITDTRGGVIAWSSAGRAGFKGSRKSTAFAATLVAQDAARQAVGRGMHEIEVRVQGAGAGRESAIRALQSSGLNIALIKDITSVPHNGCRPRKRRRV